MAEPGSEQSETFKVMERKLDVIIMRPALVLVYATGITLAIKADSPKLPGSIGNFLLVLLLTGLYLYLVRCAAAFLLRIAISTPRNCIAC